MPHMPHFDYASAAASPGTMLSPGMPPLGDGLPVQLNLSSSVSQSVSQPGSGGEPLYSAQLAHPTHPAYPAHAALSRQSQSTVAEQTDEHTDSEKSAGVWYQ